MNEPKSEEDNYLFDRNHTLAKIAELISERAELERQIRELKQEMGEPETRENRSELRTPVDLTQKEYFNAFTKTELLNLLGDKDNPVLKGDKLITRTFLFQERYKKLEADQSGKDFYIPGPEEVEELYTYKYPVSNPEYRKYAVFLRKEIQKMLRQEMRLTV